MKKIVNLEKYREKKREDDSFEEFESEFREIPEEEFAELLDENGDFKFISSNDYTIYDDEFLKENAEHIINHTLPFCIVCNSPLGNGDRVDSMWPLEYGNNVCKKCEEKLPKKIKKEKVVNLRKLELIFVKEDFEKIIENLNKKDIVNVMGNKIISEELFYKIKYQILGMEDDLRL